MKGKIETKPTYDINEVKQLVANGRFVAIRKARNFIRNRYPDMHVNEVIKDVFDVLQPERFHKTLELDKFPGQFGDVYFVDYADETWYVKFMKDEEEKVRIRVLSCKWDGFQF